MTNEQNPQLSSKVNAQTLDLMYNNFTKIVDWVLKGEQSQFPLPPALKTAMDALRAADHKAGVANDLAAQATAKLEQQAHEIAGLRADLAAVIDRLTVLESAEEKPKRTRKKAEPAHAQAAPATPAAPEAPTAPAQPSPQPEPQMADLGALQSQPEPPAPQSNAPANIPGASPNEEAINLTAASINAGDVNPVSLAALETEIARAAAGGTV